MQCDRFYMRICVNIKESFHVLNVLFENIILKVCNSRNNYIIITTIFLRLPDFFLYENKNNLFELKITNRETFIYSILYV